MDEQQEPKIHVSPDEARRFIEAVLEGNKVPAEDAVIISKGLVAADLRAVDTHGINRIPSYMTRIRNGILDPVATPLVKQVTPVVHHVDGRNGFGFVAAQRGIDLAIEAAKVYGIGMTSVKGSNHYGMAAWIVKEALKHDMMSLVFTNSSPALPPFGGKSKIIGTSPIACGAPGSEPDRDFILDMAPSVAARGKIYKAKRRGEQIPGDWALDSDGKPTTDPDAALGGVLLPMGGPKGSALAIMMDVFSGVLSGSAFAGQVTGPYDFSRPADVGHFFVVIKPDLFMGLEDFKQRMGTLYERITGSEPAHGVDRVYFTGEREILEQKRREEGGIPLVRAEIDALNEEARRVGVDELKAL